MGLTAGLVLIALGIVMVILGRPRQGEDIRPFLRSPLPQVLYRRFAWSCCPWEPHSPSPNSPGEQSTKCEIERPAITTRRREDQSSPIGARRLRPMAGQSYTDVLPVAL
jgi:hypothetical protein